MGYDSLYTFLALTHLNFDSEKTKATFGRCFRHCCMVFVFCNIDMLLGLF